MANPDENKENVSSKIGIYKGEFAKITWPTRQEMVKQTITVIITCAIIAAVIFVMDIGLNELLSLLVGIISG